MSTDAMRAAALKIVAAYDAYRHRGMAPAPGEYAGVVAAIEEARAALAQPVSAEPVAPIANVQVFGCYDAAQVPLDVRGVYQLDGFTTGVYVDMPSGACAPIAPTPTSAERVPLTDEQLTDIWNASLLKPQSVYAFARAIERAHGIGEPK